MVGAMLAGQGKATAPNLDANWETFSRVAGALVMDAAGPGVLLLNAGRRTILVSRSVADLLGYSSDEMIGMDFLEIAQRGFEAEVEKTLSLDRARIPGPKEVPLRRKDGEVIWALLLLSPVFDRQGEYVGAVATLCDLTPQKRREDVLRERVARLEAAVRSSAAPTTTEIVRGAVVLGTCATFVTTVALLTGWGVVSALLYKGDKRERLADSDYP